MGRTHLKVAARGGEVLSFECGRGCMRDLRSNSVPSHPPAPVLTPHGRSSARADRFSASTAAAQSLARRMHGSRCLLAGVGRSQNLAGPAITRYKSSTAAAVDAGFTAAKQANKRAES